MNDRLQELLGESGSLQDVGHSTCSEFGVKHDTFSGSNICFPDDSLKKREKKRNMHIKWKAKKKGQFAKHDDKPPSSNIQVQLLQNVESVKSDIIAITRATKQITEMNERARFTISAEEEGSLSKELLLVTNETNVIIKRAKENMGQIRGAASCWKKKVGTSISSGYVNEKLYGVLSLKLIAETKLYYAAQQQYNEERKDNLRRQIKHIAPDATDDDINLFMQSDKGVDGLFQAAILKGNIADTIKIEHERAISTYQDVQIIERSIAELYRMFVDMALLIDHQGETLDHIEIQVKNATEHVEDANGNLHESIRYLKRIRKKHLCVIMIVVIVAAIVVAFVVL